MAPRVPDLRARLSEVALQMYEERGYAGTTVAEIAERAGVTERTYFRHFPDKREVLFANDPALRDAIGQAIETTSPSRSDLEAARAALDAVAHLLEPRHGELLRRERVVSTSAELRERELTKLASWTSAIEDGLVRRRSPAAAAALLAEVSMSVFLVAVRRWMAGSGTPSLTSRVDEAFAELTAFVQDARTPPEPVDPGIAGR
jgi:AcrR family transcriptional regulator